MKQERLSLDNGFQWLHVLYFTTKIQWSVRGRFALALGTKLQRRVPWYW